MLLCFFVHLLFVSFILLVTDCLSVCFKLQGISDETVINPENDSGYLIECIFSMFYYLQAVFYR
ncbi:hypothetical protein DXA95_12505 [Odoribacter sp. OF09-27XD]|nr:hypothetical protein DXA95_12505 [Odoribacter sp. OF09-27XD]HBO25346.1 hypothetical protein [Culturomica sp.]